RHRGGAATRSCASPSQYTPLPCSFLPPRYAGPQIAARRKPPAMTHTATLADLLARAEPNQPAIIEPESGATTTYHSLAAQVEQLAAGLRGSGLEPGTGVAAVLPHGLDSLAVFLAVTRARLIAAPLNPNYKPEEFRFYLEDAGARVVIAPPGAHPVREVAGQLGLPVWSTARSGGRVELQGAGAAGQV